MQVSKIMLPGVESILWLDYLVCFGIFIMIASLIVMICQGEDGKGWAVLFSFVFWLVGSIVHDHGGTRENLGWVIGPSYKQDYDRKIEMNRAEAARSFWKEFLSTSMGSVDEVPKSAKVELVIDRVDAIVYYGKNQSYNYADNFRIEASIPGESKKWLFFVSFDSLERQPKVGEKIRLTLDFSVKMFQDGYIRYRDYEILDS